MERLDLLPRDLVQPLVAEDRLDAQPVQLLVASPGPLARLDVGQVVVVEELVEGQDRLLAPSPRPAGRRRAGSRPSAGVAFLRASAREMSVVRPIFWWHVLPSLIFVAQVVGALAGAGRADLDVEAGQFGVAELDAALAVGAVELVGEDVLSEFDFWH